ncbi:MAG: ferritin family protein [Archaeoglobaceae archaeon]
MYELESLNELVELVENKEFDLFVLLSLAIKSEINAHNNYESLSELEISHGIKKTLIRLRDQEMEHENILRDIFAGFYPGKEPNTSIATPYGELDVSETGNIFTLLRRAMEEEKKSEEFYKKLSHKLEGANRKLVSYLSYIEREHYETLRKELEEAES